MRRIAISLLSLSLATVAVACKKKGEEPAKKPVEGAAGSTAPGSAAPGSAAPESPTPGVAASAGGAPTEAKNLLDAAKADGRFGTLLQAIDTAGLAATFSGAGPFTVLAPTDEAFAKVPPKDLEALLADKAKLEAVLQRHVVTGTVSAKDLGTQKAVKSLAGDELAVDASSGLKLQGAAVVGPDLVASNGVLHAIDTVLLP